MEHKDFYEVNGCIDFIPVTIVGKYEDGVIVAPTNDKRDCQLVVEEVYRLPKVDEPQKVTVPKFVAEWIEELKKSHSNLAWVWQVYPNEPKIKKWLDSNTEKFMRAWIYGYEIEQVKLYTVEIPDPNSYVYYRYLGRNDNGICIDASNDAKWKQKKRNQFTESEIKQDFEWAWKWAKEVE